MKNKIALLLVSIIGLVGCNNNGGVSKQDKTIFDKTDEYIDTLNTEEITELNKKIVENLESISYLEIETKNTNRGSLFENSSTVKTKRENNGDGCSISSETTLSSYRSGIKLTQKTSLESYYLSLGKTILYYSKDQDDKKSFYVVQSGYQTQEQADEKARSYAIESAYNSSNHTWYAKKDGSVAIINNQQNLLIQAVEWGKETKDLYQLIETSSKYTVTRDGFITGYTYKYQIVTNRDQQTGEWFKNNTIVESNEKTISFNYGAPLNNPNKNSLIDSLSNNYFMTAISSTKLSTQSSYSTTTTMTNQMVKVTDLSSREVTATIDITLYVGSSFEITTNAYVANLIGATYLNNQLQEKVLPLNASLLKDNSDLFETYGNKLRYLGDQTLVVTITIKYTVVVNNDGILGGTVSEMSIKNYL